MTVDLLTQVTADNVDVVFLYSGDGDYVPVIEEAQRHGKRVEVSALSSGLSTALKNVSDHFVNLDSVFFHPSNEKNGVT